MTRASDSAKRRTDLVSKAAKALPDVGEGVACAGTAIESKTYTVRGKAFLFIGPKNMRMKLARSVAEARAAALQASSAVQVGAGGWTTILLAEGNAPADAMLQRWVKESHALFGSPTTPPPARKSHAKVAAKPRRARRRA